MYLGRMRGLNNVTLIGNISKDPEVNVLEGNVAVAKYSLATSKTRRDKAGQLHTTTNWHGMVLWRGQAELAQVYLDKGNPIHLEGKFKTRHYDNAAGVRHYVSEIVGEQLLLTLDKTSSIGPCLLGLRLSKVLHLTPADTDSRRRMALYVRGGKDKKDRAC